MATKPDMLLGFDSFDKGEPTTELHDFNLRSSCQIRSCDKIKNLLQETYGYQTWHVIRFW